MNWRPYDPEKDKEAAHRIWYEVGWIDTSKEGEVQAMDLEIESGNTVIAEVHGAPECLVVNTPGVLRHLDQDLSMACVVGVTTSRVARKQGLAQRLTAKAIARDVAEGAALAGLGMFDQGFYNKLGFGTGDYVVTAAFDPAHLDIPVKAPPPQRLTADDWAAVHESRVSRRRGHGACSLLCPESTHAGMVRSGEDFGLGYRENGRLTHHVWFGVEKRGRGPYRVNWMAYETLDQFLELMALIAGLGDQVRVVRVNEPPDILIQDFIARPFYQDTVRRRSEYQTGIDACAYWQRRICDLETCLAATNLSCDAFRFNLKLTDPIEVYLDENDPWRGITGDYVVTLGASSRAEAGHDDSCPTLEAGVGPFTRMWLGVRPATGLAAVGGLSGPPELLTQLDRAFQLPRPMPDWDF